MHLPISSYVVFIYNEDIGAFAPAFPDLDKAEEFANAMRLTTSNLSVSEPVPVTVEQNLRVKIEARDC